LQSLEKFCAGVRVEIIVLDNASTDGTADFVATHFPQALLIRSGINTGFARGIILRRKRRADATCSF
jgi:GT2 family glycosyltransferase